MLPVAVRRVLLAEHRVDFRKRFDGLLAEAYRVARSPTTATAWSSSRRIGRRSARWSVIATGSISSAVASKEDVCVRCSSSRSVPDARTISTGELSLLLEGSSFTVHKRAKPWRARQENQPPEHADP